VKHIPEIVPGMNLGDCLRAGLLASGIAIKPGDILAVTQKIVSKAEGRVVRLDGVTPSDRSRIIGEQMQKDPRLVEVILGETRRIVRMRSDVIICETHHGFICANAGVDSSNVERGVVTLLPKDPDRSARGLADALRCAVLVTDTFGRVWREGLVDTAIGVAGLAPLVDLRGEKDSQGNTLNTTTLAVADALAAAAGLSMGKTQGTPAALIHGYVGNSQQQTELSIKALLRAPERDLFL
jgi:coenzyme F420-0:L-glutamate ligase / coenzyme F420-1:gamma-L-glutamate ligase